MTKSELVEVAYEITGGSMPDLSYEQLARLTTVAQHVTDLCLNELERRGQLTFSAGTPIVPYDCEYWSKPF